MTLLPSSSSQLNSSFSDVNASVDLNASHVDVGATDSPAGNTSIRDSGSGSAAAVHLPRPSDTKVHILNICHVLFSFKLLLTARVAVRS